MVLSAAPTSVSATVVATGINLTWTAPAAVTPAITRYEANTGDGWVFLANAPATSGSLAVLGRGLPYSVTIRAVNADGPSPASAPVTLWLPASTRTAPPEIKWRKMGTTTDVQAWEYDLLTGADARRDPRLVVPGGGGYVVLPDPDGARAKENAQPQAWAAYYGTGAAATVHRVWLSRTQVGEGWARYNIESEIRRVTQRDYVVNQTGSTSLTAMINAWASAVGLQVSPNSSIATVDLGAVNERVRSSIILRYLATFSDGWCFEVPITVALSASTFWTEKGSIELKTSAGVGAVSRTGVLNSASAVIAQAVGGPNPDTVVNIYNAAQPPGLPTIEYADSTSITQWGSRSSDLPAWFGVGGDSRINTWLNRTKNPTTTMAISLPLGTGTFTEADIAKIQPGTVFGFSIPSQAIIEHALVLSVRHRKRRGDLAYIDVFASAATRGSGTQGVWILGTSALGTGTRLG